MGALWGPLGALGGSNGPLACFLRYFSFHFGTPLAPKMKPNMAKHRHIILYHCLITILGVVGSHFGRFLDMCWSLWDQKAEKGDDMFFTTLQCDCSFFEIPMATQLSQIAVHNPSADAIFVSELFLTQCLNDRLSNGGTILGANTDQIMILSMGGQTYTP